MTPSAADRRRTLVEVLAEALLRLTTDPEISPEPQSGASEQPTREK